MLPRTKKQEADCPKELLEKVWQAKHIEWQSLQMKGCYSELMDLPPGHKAHRHVWVLRAKPNGAGLIFREGESALRARRKQRQRAEDGRLLACGGAGNSSLSDSSAHRLCRRQVLAD